MSTFRSAILATLATADAIHAERPYCAAALALDPVDAELVSAELDLVTLAENEDPDSRDVATLSYDWS